MNAPLRRREMPVLAGTLPGHKPEPAFFPAERQMLIHGVIETLLGEPAVVMIRGAWGVGKTTVAGVLEGRLARLGWRVIRPVAGRHGPLDLQRMIGEALGIAEAHLMMPADFALAVEAAPACPVAAVILDGAEALPSALFHYVSLILVLLNLRGKRLNVVFLGALGCWRGLDPDYLEPLRRAARLYVVPEFTDRQAREYLEHRLAAARVPPGRRLTRRAVAELLDQADGLPGRLDMLLAQALQRRRRGHGRSAAKLSAAGLGFAAAFLLGLYFPVLLDRGAKLLSAPVLTAMLSGRTVAGKTVPPVAFSNPRREPASRPDRPPETAQVPAPPPAVTPAPALAPLAPLAEATAPPPLPAASSKPPPAIEDEPPRPAPTGKAVLAPSSMRKGSGLAVIAQPGDTLVSLYTKVYHGMTAPPYPAVAAVNHLPLRAGAIVVFPTPQDGWTIR